MKNQNIIQSHLIQESQNIRSHSKTKPNQHDANWVINFTYLVCPLDRDQIRIEKDVFFLTLVYVDIYIFTNRFFCDVL